MSKPKTIILPGKYDKINLRLAPYIFDENKVLNEVPYSQFTTNNDQLCFGLILPKETEDGQKNQHVVITSAGGFIEINRKQPELRNLGIKFSDLPVELPKRYSLTLLPQWVHEKAVLIDQEYLKPTLKKVFAEFKKGYEKYSYFGREEWYTVHALWDLGTYFFQLFPAYPYMEVRGLKGSGKTKIMDISRLFSFNPTPVYTSPTEAVLFRVVHDQRPTLYLDEAENLFRIIGGKVEHDSRVEVLNSGYTKSGRVPRIEKIGNQFVTKVYHTYCPKMLGSINGLRGATESRAIIHVMTRAPDKDLRGELEVEEQLSSWQDIRNMAVISALINHKDVKNAYSKVGSVQTNLKKRYFQIWRPLLAIASLIGEEEYSACLTIARQQQEIGRAEEVSSDSWEGVILQRMYDLLKAGNNKILIKEIADAFPIDQRPGNKSIGTMIGKLGFRDCWQHFREGNGYAIESFDFFKSIAEPIASHIFSSLPSPASQNTEFEGLKIDVVNIGEEKANSVNNTSELCERGDSRERTCEKNELLTEVKKEPIEYSILLVNHSEELLQSLLSSGDLAHYGTKVGLKE